MMSPIGPGIFPGKTGALALFVPANPSEPTAGTPMASRSSDSAGPGR